MSSAMPRFAIQDTNLLLLSLVGETDPALIASWKRVDTFDIAALHLLRDVLRPFSDQMTTPHILAEASNFVDQAPTHRRANLIDTLSHFIKERSERYEEAAQLVGRPEFPRLGLADTGLLSRSSEAVVITTDFRLAHQISRSGGHAINFNHLRGRRMVPR